MCDTWVALPDTTLDGRLIFAKNSDRPIFDCQPLLLRPRQKWPPDSRIQTSYLDLPQVENTFAHLGAQPYWCWGYELGLNEHGLAIGNEAIYTKPFRQASLDFQQGHPIQPGLLGMDLIRLALERCTDAFQAVELIGRLLEQYGQFGSGSPSRPHNVGSYDNAFLVADPSEAWIVETAGKRWVARRLTHGVASISNEPTIRTEWHLGSPDLQDYALKQGWWAEAAPGATSIPFDFARAYIDEKSSRQVSHMRLMRSRKLLEERRGQVTPQWMMRIARDHYEDSFLGGPAFDAADPDFLSLCMHSSPADFTWGNTASSCVAVLPQSTNELPYFWWTPSTPCNGCYVPFFPQSSLLPEIVSRVGTLGRHVTPADQAAEDSFSPDSYWWLFRRLNDCVKGDALRSLPGCYAQRNPVVRLRFDELEASFAAQLPAVMQRAVAARLHDPASMSRILDEFTFSCIGQVVSSLHDLLAMFPLGETPG